MDLGERPHLTLFLDPAAARPIEALRARFDPATAAQIAAHLTLVYPEEAPDFGLVVERLRSLGLRTAPIPLHIGEVATWGGPDGGVFARVEDRTGQFARTRAALLAPPCTPFTPAVAAPHVTLVHPRTSRRTVEAWRELAGTRFDIDVTIDEVAVTSFDGERWHTAETVELARGEASPAVTLREVAVALHRDGEVLHLRNAGRDAWTGLWWLPSGEAEPNESFYDAARRAVWEETGLVVKDLVCLSHATDTRPDGRRYESRLFVGHVDDPDVRLSWRHDAWRFSRPDPDLGEADDIAERSQDPLFAEWARDVAQPFAEATLAFLGSPPHRMT